GDAPDGAFKPPAQARVARDTILMIPFERKRAAPDAELIDLASLAHAQSRPDPRAAALGRPYGKALLENGVKAGHGPVRPQRCVGVKPGFIIASPLTGFSGAGTNFGSRAGTEA